MRRFRKYLRWATAWAICFRGLGGACAIATAWLGVAHAASAATILLSPRPYLSRADSPFPVDGSNPQFFLEDFEDGELNTPGISQYDYFPPELGGIFLGKVVGPGPNAHSVDGDDGLIDGSGTTGRGFQSGLHLAVPTIPEMNEFHVAFDFTYEIDAPLPNAFGFVWTAGPPSSELQLSITTSSGSTTQFTGLTLGNEDDPKSANDRFFGVRSAEPIQSVRIVGKLTGNLVGFGSITIDHVQYGTIPEPQTVPLLCSGALSLALAKRREANRRLILPPD